MAEYDEPEERISELFRERAQQDVERCEVALYKAAMLGEPIVVEATPSDTGATRQGWRTQRTGDGAWLVNDAPLAAILEFGSRPHWPPLKPILEWVVRKWGLDLAGGRRSIPGDSIENVPWPTYQAAKTVQEKIALKGTKPHYMIRKNLDELTRIAKRETGRAMRNRQSFNDDDIPF